MPIEAFFIVLGAALVHATWNAFASSPSSRCRLRIAPFLLVSARLNTDYMFMLNRAYQSGDLSLVYPVARGLAPVVVAIVSTVALGQVLSYANQMAVLLIGLGITSLALSGKPGSLKDLRPFVLAVATAVFVGAYHDCEWHWRKNSGKRSRLCGLALARYINCHCRMHALAAAGTTGADPQPHPECWHRSRNYELWLSLGRNLGLTLAPFALVSALRETGVVFAVLIGFVVLKERASLARVASIATTLIGTSVLKVGR